MSEVVRVRRALEMIGTRCALRQNNGRQIVPGTVRRRGARCCGKDPARGARARANVYYMPYINIKYNRGDATTVFLSDPRVFRYSMRSRRRGPARPQNAGRVFPAGA